MGNLKFQFISVYVVNFIKAFTNQYALTSQIILLDENNYFKEVPHVNRNYLSDIIDKKVFSFTYDACKFEVIYSKIPVEQPFITDRSLFPPDFDKQICKKLQNNGFILKWLPEFIKGIKMVHISEDKEYHGYVLAPLMILIDENDQYIKSPLIEKDEEDGEEVEYPLDPNNIERKESFTYKDCNLELVLLKNPLYDNSAPKTPRYNLDHELNALIDKKVGDYNIDPFDLTKTLVETVSENSIRVFTLNDRLTVPNTNALALNYQTILLDKDKYFISSSTSIREHILEASNTYRRINFDYEGHNFEVIILEEPLLDLLLTNNSCLPEEFNLQVERKINEIEHINISSNPYSDATHDINGFTLSIKTTETNPSMKWITDVEAFALDPQRIILDKDNYFQFKTSRETHILCSKNIDIEHNFKYDGHEFKLVILTSPILYLPLTSFSCLPEEFNLQVKEKITSTQYHYHLKPTIESNTINIFTLQHMVGETATKCENAFALSNQILLVYKKFCSYFEKRYELNLDNIHYVWPFEYDGDLFDLLILKNPIIDLPITNNSYLPKTFNRMIENKLDQTRKKEHLTSN